MLYNFILFGFLTFFYLCDTDEAHVDINVLCIKL